MIDYGLLLSVILALGVPSLLLSRWPLASYSEPIAFFDVALGPGLVGLAAGRLAALAFDDPSSIGSIKDMIIIRSGVEFWVGVAAAAAVLSWKARQSGVTPMVRLADVAALTMIGYATYESSCIFRDGCFGPLASVGLRPSGLDTTMLPIGLLMGVAVAIAAVGVRHLSARGTRPAVVVLSALSAVAVTRAVGSIWLPHVGDDLTRQHVTSIAIAIVASLALIGFIWLTMRQRPGQESLHEPRERPETLM